MKTKTNDEIYSTISKAEAPGQSSGAKKVVDYRHLTTGDVLKLEFLPLLNRIISPPLRPVGGFSDLPLE